MRETDKSIRKFLKNMAAKPAFGGIRLRFQLFVCNLSLMKRRDYFPVFGKTHWRHIQR